MYNQKDYNIATHARILAGCSTHAVWVLLVKYQANLVLSLLTGHKSVRYMDATSLKVSKRVPFAIFSLNTLKSRLIMRGNNLVMRHDLKKSHNLRF